MGSIVPGVIAFALGTVLAVAGLVPWAAREYRRHGKLGVRRGLLAFGTLVYALALVTYTLLPLPDDVAAVCRTAARPQLQPFAFVGDIVREGGITGPRSVLGNPAVAQLLLNVLLFVPLGALVRHAVLRRRLVAGLLVGGAAGFVLSLLIEFTQLTGDWFLYPCAYRLFDVDDLIANTAGALLGTLFAPVVGLLAGSARTTEEARVPRPVTAGRRFFGILADVLAIWFTTGLLTSVTSVGLALLGVPDGGPLAVGLGIVAAVTAPTLQLVIVLVSGRTFGEHVVRLRPVPVPGGAARLVRWALGSGGWSALTASGLPFSGLIAFALAVAAVIGVWATRDRRGFASAVAGTGIEDDVDTEVPAAEVVAGDQRP
ncbi:VanZ family protein [Curtobacterium sp. MCPF17_050]|uniref:VanZ family protein n=1 Tax=Curtobacterium sp. MCPF17_050 TaxID=2175664 RepID=UPI000D9FD098|nr:VanZ family protein [Curtobacterium sp. MCPF17_050]WIB15701.1 VanZ family protein [Curtobacterium sp. MCPF17_050]